MSDRNRKIVEAAASVFARYGVGKTTMNDIAREAGIARQTLYNSYPGKDEVLRATVRHFHDLTLANVEAAWTDETGFAGKIDRFFELGPLAWFDLVQSAPDASELIDGIHTVAADELKHSAEVWEDRFAALLIQHAPAPRLDTLDVTALAEFLYSASLNAKYGAESRAVLELRLSILKASVLALLGLN